MEINNLNSQLTDNENEIDILIRSRYPLLYIVSWEESRVEAFLQGLARAQGKVLLSWSATRGLAGLSSASAGSSLEPMAALEEVGRSGQKAIFVFRDFHPHLQDPKIIRRLRDLVNDLKSTYKTIVFLGPVLTIPVELEKDITVIDYDLPGKKELSPLVDSVISSVMGGHFHVDFSPAEREKIVQAAQGLTLAEAENALARALVHDKTLGDGRLTVEEVEDTLLAETKQIIRKSRLLEYFEAQEAFGQIGGLDLLKEWLSKRGEAFTEKARQFGLPEPRGLLLMGVQGCGKSMTCKAISALWKMPLLRLDMGSIFGQYVGQSEENMRRAIKTAESVAPCVLWLDEIEKGLSGSQSSGSVDAGTTSRIFSTFLTWLQEKKKPVFVAATANNIHQLPPELLRKGRLDEIFFIDLPTEKERLDIFAIHLRRRKRDAAAFDAGLLARMAEGFSGAEIEQAVIEGLHSAFAAGRDLSTEDLKNALAETVPLSTTMADQIGDLRTWARTRARPASGATRTA
ncbi:MAG: AAA family ATPase [Elusimicrobia bacterium]|nr:AAA family ATPase [Elusimicrobiota bacterium]MBK7207477.1 AAA family ATPase [Elusimicrobiota bacterium]MBK7544247.1 AAA family ATPase [Elusimicrobiota bacterium]MBK7573769.1 AAA family ATPase [Elusimicrobiota bacterium]MBK8125913.1 AAA family ATPase [Elusimicrobiota bacterium]